MTEEMDNIVVLTDEDGNDVQFEHVVTVMHKNREFVCLIPIAGIDYGEDVDKARAAILEALGREPLILADPEPTVALGALGSSPQKPPLSPPSMPQ